MFPAFSKWRVSVPTPDTVLERTDDAQVSQVGHRNVGVEQGQCCEKSMHNLEAGPSLLSEFGK